MGNDGFGLDISFFAGALGIDPDDVDAVDGVADSPSLDAPAFQDVDALAAAVGATPEEADFLAGDIAAAVGAAASPRGGPANAQDWGGGVQASGELAQLGRGLGVSEEDVVSAVESLAVAQVESVRDSAAPRGSGATTADRAPTGITHYEALALGRAIGAVRPGGRLPDDAASLMPIQGTPDDIMEEVDHVLMGREPFEFPDLAHEIAEAFGPRGLAISLLAKLAIDHRNIDIIRDNGGVLTEEEEWGAYLRSAAEVAIGIIPASNLPISRDAIERAFDSLFGPDIGAVEGARARIEHAQAMGIVADALAGHGVMRPTSDPMRGSSENDGRTPEETARRARALRLRDSQPTRGRIELRPIGPVRPRRLGD